MSSNRSVFGHLAPRDKRERKYLVSRTASASRDQRPYKAERDDLGLHLILSHSPLSDARTRSKIDELVGINNESVSGYVGGALRRSNSLTVPDDSNSFHRKSLSSFDTEWSLPQKHRRRNLLNIKRRSHSASNLCQQHPFELPWVVELRVYTAYDLNPSIVHDGINTCIKITQNGITLGKTAVKPTYSQQVWEQTFTLTLAELQTPILLQLCSRKSTRLSTLGVARLPLNECLTDITYTKHLDIIGIKADNILVGMLWIHVCVRVDERSSPVQRKNSSFEESHRVLKTRSIARPKLPSVVGITDTRLIQRGPLSSGVQIFEVRYLGLLHLHVVTRPSHVYARRWSPLEYQPGEVAIITNPMTKATEIVCPRLSWPPHFLRGVSALEFNPVAGLQVAQFDSAVLHLNVLSVCGLQSILLSKFLNKCKANEGAVDSVHRGVMVAKLMSYHQTMAKNAQKLSTFVHLQLGKDKYTTKVRKCTYEPVWNQTFTFNLTRSSKTLVEIQLMNVANPNISGPASCIEKLGEALIDISRLPMDFTQRIEVELNGYRPKPRLLLLATLTGLARNEPPSGSLVLPTVVISGETSGPRSDTESVRDCCKSLQCNISKGSINTCSSELSITPETDEALSPSQKVSLSEPDAQIVEHYGWKMALKNRFDVGYLRVKVIAATGLTAKDVNGKPNPYCLVELINMRAQTHTIKKTINPSWQKTFVFPVTDIHAILYVTVNDEDKTKSDFLGRVAIPLLKIRNHERSWYALKNACLRERSKGSILLEFFFVYNQLKAAWRTLNPVERCLNHPVIPQKYRKLSVEYRNTVQENYMRLKVLFKPVGMVTQIFNSICSWQNPWYSLITLILYNLIVWNFQPYMLPLGMIVGILINRHASRNPYLLDVMSSLKVFAGVGASNLGTNFNHEKFLKYGNLEHDSEDFGDTSPKSSIDDGDNVYINNDLLFSLELEVRFCLILKSGFYVYCPEGIFNILIAITTLNV
uniref:C2 domain-containing protein n=1 Tax=Mesocestoides corti TaxID=53468 RepID=A0A5K3EQS7_MESCO